MKKGDEVHWKWGKYEAQGKIVEKHTEPTEETIKGSKVKRNASKKAPAYDIKQKDGSRVLKSESELKKTHK